MERGGRTTVCLEQTQVFAVADFDPMCPTRSCNFTEHSKDDSSPIFLSTTSWILRFLFETSDISYNKKKSEILLRRIDRVYKLKKTCYISWTCGINPINSSQQTKRQGLWIRVLLFHLLSVQRGLPTPPWDFVKHTAASNWALLPLDGICVCAHAAFVSPPPPPRPQAEGTPQMVSHNALLCPAGEHSDLKPSSHTLACKGGFHVGSEAF